MTPLSLPTLPPGAVRLWNALACRLLPVSLALDNGQEPAPQVRLTCPVAGGEGIFSAGAAHTLYVNLNGLWRVEFGNLEALALRPELDAWLRADTANHFEQLPEGLVRAVLERMFLPVLDGLSRHMGLPAIFVGIPRAASSRPMFTEHLHMLLRVEGERPLNIPLRVAWQDTATLAPVVERLETLPLHPLPPTLTVASVAAGIVLGGMRLTPGELRGLRLGDVLLPPGLKPGGPRLRLACGLYLACSLEGSTLTVRALDFPGGRATHGEHTMSDTAAENTAQESTAASGQPTDPLLGQEELGALELDITFELPGLRLPLAECARLVPGHTFTLSADVANLPVTVRAGGRAVALGRLVDVGGPVGVQITQLPGGSAARGDAGGVKDSAKEGN